MISATKIGVDAEMTTSVNAAARCQHLQCTICLEKTVVLRELHLPRDAFVKSMLNVRLVTSVNKPTDQAQVGIYLREHFIDAIDITRAIR